MSSVVLFFGQYLVSEGHVTQSQLDEAVQFQEQHNLPLGAVALSKALMSERQVLIVHAQQARTDKQFGQIAVERGFLSRAQLDELLREQSEARILLGEALIQKGAILVQEGPNRLVRAVAPDELRFEPGDVHFDAADARDPRDLLASIPVGSTIYRVYAKTDGAEPVLVGVVRTQSPFVASTFEDRVLHFVHAR